MLGMAVGVFVLFLNQYINQSATVQCSNHRTTIQIKKKSGTDSKRIIYNLKRNSAVHRTRVTKIPYNIKVPKIKCCIE